MKNQTQHPAAGPAPYLHQLSDRHGTSDSKWLDQMTMANNEMVTLQREMAKKNVELERLYAEVQRLAIFDELTHVYNRRGFLEISRREISRSQRQGKPVVGIMMDIDHFKKFNDTYGHSTGDQVLREVAARCSGTLRNCDVIGRYGGEEFCVLLPDSSLEAAMAAAERIRATVATEPTETDKGGLFVTISIGVAKLDTQAEEIEGLLKCADKALYEAKESGRNRVCCYDLP